MSKITRRSYKRKKIVTGIALFGAIGLVSTGFAAWVLSTNANKEQGAGLKVGTVTESAMEITNVKVKGIDTRRSSETLGEVIEVNEFSFNPRYDDNTGRVKYGAVGDDCGERLSLTVSGTITQAQNLGALRIEPKTVPDKILEKENDGFIVVPTCLKEAVTLVKDTDYEIKQDNTADFEFAITFEWGTVFGGENPADYYDDFTVEQVSNAQINETLASLYELNNVQIAINIVAEVN